MDFICFLKMEEDMKTNLLERWVQGIVLKGLGEMKGSRERNWREISYQGKPGCRSELEKRSDVWH